MFRTRTLVEHFASGRWIVHVSPNAANSFGELDGVAALSATDVWAVGNNQSGNRTCPCGENKTLIEHFDGRKWTVVKSPSYSR